MRLSARALDVVFAAGVVSLKVIAMLYALRCGFAQVSDDDYARTVIAQTFAHSPHLDPSGTSWLPLPFWVFGGAMMLFGRSLEVARGLAFGLGALAPVVTYVGLRAMGNARTPAFFGAVLAALTPWSVWLGLAPVPEVWAGTCAAAALFFVASANPRHVAVAGGLALVAALSRYEAWPVAGFVVVVCVMRAVRAKHASAPLILGALLALAGPALWLVNNWHAHGDPLHFVARVAAFRRATIAAPLRDRLLEYPLGLVRDAREIVLVGLVGAAAVLTGRVERSRWALPLSGAGCVLAFLIYGDVRDGAPTHHPVRALIPVITVLAAFGGAGIAAFVGARGARIVLGASALLWVVFLAQHVRNVPGSSEIERRTTQIERGRALAATGGALDVTPCAYEHYALIAAFGAPERVTIEQATHEPINAQCPHVMIR